MLTSCISSFISLSLAGLAAAAAPIQLDACNNTETVYEFPNGTWLENLAVRSDGTILTSLLMQAEIYLVDPSNQAHVLVHHFNETGAVLGIVENAPMEPDVFYVATGNFSATDPTSYLNASAIWRLDMTSFKTSHHGTEVSCPATASKLTDIPAAGILNGMTQLSHNGTLLVADSTYGHIYSVDASSGAYHIAYADDYMLPLEYVGVNGVKVVDGYVYFTNTEQELFCRFPINSHGLQTAPTEVVADGFYADDFCFLPNEGAHAFIASANVLREIETCDGADTVAAGAASSTALLGTTACEPARGSHSKDIVYVTTNGGEKEPLNGYTEGGKIVRVHV